MKAKVLISFNAFNIMAFKNDVIEIDDPRIYLDLYQAGFVGEQIQRTSEEPAPSKRKKKKAE